MSNSTPVELKQEVVPRVPVNSQNQVATSPLPGMESTSSFEHLMQLVHCLRKERDAAHQHLARLQKEHADRELSRSSSDAWQQRVLDMLQDLATTTKHSLDKHTALLEAQEAVLKTTCTELMDRLRKLTDGAMQVISDAKKLATLNQQLEKYVAEMAHLQAMCRQLENSNMELEQKYKDIVSKELEVRRIAKKYKTQFDELQSQINNLQEGAPAESLKRSLEVANLTLCQAAKHAKASGVQI